jgi:hypothetical protein
VRSLTRVLLCKTVETRTSSPAGRAEEGRRHTGLTGASAGIQSPLLCLAAEAHSSMQDGDSSTREEQDKAKLGALKLLEVLFVGEFIQYNYVYFSFNKYI